MPNTIDLYKVKKSKLTIVLGFAIKIINICGFDIYVSTDNFGNLKFKLKDLSKKNRENIESEFYPTFSTCFHRLSPYYLGYSEKILNFKNIKNISKYNLSEIISDFYENTSIAYIMENVYPTNKGNFVYVPNNIKINRDFLYYVKTEDVLEYIENNQNMFDILKDYSLDPDCQIFNKSFKNVSLFIDKKSDSLIFIDKDFKITYVFGNKENLSVYLNSFKNNIYRLYLKKNINKSIRKFSLYMENLDEFILDIENITDNKILGVKFEKDIFFDLTKEEIKEILVKILDNINEFYLGEK